MLVVFTHAPSILKDGSYVLSTPPYRHNQEKVSYISTIYDHRLVRRSADDLRRVLRTRRRSTSTSQVLQPSGDRDRRRILGAAANDDPRLTALVPEAAAGCALRGCVGADAAVLRRMHRRLPKSLASSGSGSVVETSNAVCCILHMVSKVANNGTAQGGAHPRNAVSKVRLVPGRSNRIRNVLQVQANFLPRKPPSASQS